MENEDRPVSTTKSSTRQYVYVCGLLSLDTLNCWFGG